MTRPRPWDLVLLAAGFAIGSWFGLAVAVLGVVAVRRAPSLAPWLPVALLGLAAVATVVSEVPDADSLRPTFADDRPFAAGASLAAGILLLVLLVETAVTGAAVAVAGPRTSPAPASDVGVARADLRASVPPAVASIAAMLLGAVVGGPVLSEAEKAAAVGLRTGDGFAVNVPPIAVGLEALSPLGATALTAVLAGGLVLAMGLLVARLTDARTGTAAAIAAAAVPLTWASPLAVTAGLLALVLALGALSGRDVGIGAALGGGALLGIATLSRPELGLVAVAALAWCGLRPRPLPAPRFVAVVAAALAVTLPWVLHVEHRTGSPGLVASLGDAIRSIGELRGGVVPEGLAVVLMVAAVAAVAVRHRWFGRRLALLLPLVAGALLALVLVAADPGVVALYPALLIAALALARVAIGELDRRTSHR